MTEWILERVAQRCGTLDGKRYFYMISRTKDVSWPKRQGWWMLAFRPLCRLHNQGSISPWTLVIVGVVIGFAIGMCL